MKSVLLVDDDPGVLRLLERAYRRAGFAVTCTATGEEALAAYAHDASDLVMLDLNLPDATGLEVLARLRALDPDVCVIVLTGQSDLPTAVDAIRAGAENFLPKPLDLGHLYAAVDRAFEMMSLRQRASYLERAASSPNLELPSADSPALRQVEEKIRLVAPTETTVLLQGETGTGKSYIASRIHALSPRAAGPFVEVNCAGLSATFLESELFGHEKGAYTDARTMRRGLFEIAARGTLFLDEIGDLAPELQPKLLTAIETRRFRRLGGSRDITADVRLIAATNRDLRSAVGARTFREDLYYRLAVMPIDLPPLRERGTAEVERLAAQFADDLARRSHRRGARFSSDALQLIGAYPWPGNIREMRNVLERALILGGDSREITTAHLPPELARAAQASRPAGHIDLTLEELERHHVLRVLEHCNGNRTQAARILGISRVGLYKKLQRLEAAERAA